jgi:uncharacterized protein with PIN domain
MSELKYTKVAEDDGVLTVTINRPEVLNALSNEAHHELAGIFDRFAADASLRVAILTLGRRARLLRRQRPEGQGRGRNLGRGPRPPPASPAYACASTSTSR